MYAPFGLSGTLTPNTDTHYTDTNTAPHTASHTAPHTAPIIALCSLKVRDTPRLERDLRDESTLMGDVDSQLGVMLQVNGLYDMYIIMVYLIYYNG